MAKPKIKLAQKKVLKHDGKYVDFNRIHEGIYYTKKPDIFDLDFDIKEVKKFHSFCVEINKFPENGQAESNIDKCTLDYAFVRLRNNL